MTYIPELHNRRSSRLRDYDYSQAGGYFVTLCTHNKELCFQNYPKLKEIVANEWENILERYANIELDEFTIMPNHIHGIIIVGATLAVAQQKRSGVLGTIDGRGKKRSGAAQKRAGASPAPTIGDIIGSFKSLCVHTWLRYINENNIDAVGKFWQRNYYEHVIRSEHELVSIRQYIKDNPLKWELDRENTLSDNYKISHDLYFRSLYDS